jgi:hypothetical protein
MEKLIAEGYIMKDDDLYVLTANGENVIQGPVVAARNGG